MRFEIENKLVRRFKRFSFIKSGLILILIFSLVFYPIEPIFAATFIDDTQDEFNTGTYNETQWNTTNNWVELTETGKTNGLGSYTSSIKDAGGIASWDKISWTPQQPYYKESPNNKGQESGYPTGNADMTGNVLLLHMNEESGTIVDYSGEGNNGTTYGGVTYGAEGKFNTALEFDGVDDYVEVPDSDSLDITDEITIETWIKLKNTGKNYIVDKFHEWGLKVTDYKQTVTFFIADQSPVDFVTTETISLNTWTHIVASYDGTNRRIYFNGVEVKSDTPSGSIGTSTGSLFIGNYGGGGFSFDGKIDEVRIYNRALSAEEILDHYKRGALRLKYQVRSCDDPNCDTEQFVGPDGTTNTYYSELNNNSTTTPSFNLTNIPDNRYFQYKVYFETDNSSYTPELKSVTINYTPLNQPPDQPTNISPTDGSTGVGLNPDLVGSSFSDPENDTHIDTQWQVDDDEDFSSPVWTRTAGDGETNTTINTTNGTFANELDGKSQLNSGTIYYWRVRYKDNGSNNWSDWSSYTSFTTFLQQRMLVTISGPKECKSGENIRFVTQVKDASGEIINNAVVSIDIWKPDNTALVTDDPMTYISGSDGLYSYDYTCPSTEGIYIFSAKANFGENNGYGSDIFYVAPWISDMPSNVWNNATRTLTNYATSSIADAVWDEPRSDHTTSGSFGESLQNIVPTIADISQAIWSYAGPALDTSGNAISKVWSYTGSALNTTGNAISKVWSYTGSTLDTAGNAIAKVWSYTTRKLTSRQIGENEYIAGVSSSSTVSQVADQPTQENVEYNVELVRKATFDFAGFADSGSTTTLVDSELEGPDNYWQYYKVIFMSGNNFGEERVITSYDADSHTLSWDSNNPLPHSVSANDKYVLSHEHRLVYKIWSYTDRSLTSVGNIASAVWGWTTRSLTTRKINENEYIAGVSSSSTISQIASSEQVENIQNSISNLQTDITYIRNKVNDIYSDTQYIKDKIDNILTKWGSYSAQDIITDLDTIKSRIGTSTDISSNETLFGRTKYIQEKWGTQTAQAIYDKASSTLALVENVQTELGYNGTSTTAYTDLQLIKGYVDKLEEYIGTPSDNSSANTLFGKVKVVKEETDKLIENIIVSESSVNDSNASTTQFVTNLSNSTDDFYNNNILVFISGTNAGQVRRIVDYDGTSKKITVDPSLSSVPSDGDKFSILSQTAVSGIDAQTIWSYSTRTLTAPDLDSGSLTTLSDLQKQWTVYLSDFNEISAGKTYRAKLWVLNYESVPTNAYATPTLTIYDAVRNKVIENVEMTKISTGIYEYTYSVPSSAVQGVWETDVSVEVETGKIIKKNDYWEVEGSPAQVKINSITDNTIPSVSANVTISNEGSVGYEYQYEWCIVSSENNACGGGNDVFYSSAAKYIQAGEDWNTTLNATISNTGSYWFKVVVYYGTEKSGASQTFAAVKEEEEETQTSGGGGGGGGSSKIISSEKEKEEKEEEKEEKKPQNTFTAIWNQIEKILKRLTGVEKKTTTLTASVARLEMKLNELDKKVIKILKPAPPQIVREKVIERRVVVRKPIPQVPRRRAKIRLEGR